MKDGRGETVIDQVKFTLHERLDADVIAVLRAMPYGRKPRLIADAIRRAYRVDQNGELLEKAIGFPGEREPKETPPAAPISPPKEQRKIKIEAEAF